MTSSRRGTPSRKVKQQSDSAGPIARAGEARGYSDKVGRRLLAANTAQDALAAVVDEVRDSADFCLILQMGRVPGVDLEIAAAWGVEDTSELLPGRSIPYAVLAPFFEVESPPTKGATRKVRGSAGQRRVRAAVVTDVAHDERITPGLQQMLTLTRTGSFVAVPMSYQGQMRALFVVGRHDPAEYDATAMQHYEWIAEQLVGALHSLDLLQQSQTRAAQLEVVAEISSAASSILDLDELLPLAVELLRERFHLYYVGIFLLDPDDRRVTLHAGTGVAGQKMVEARHHFAVGDESMIGWCVANRQPRIALDVGQEAVRFDNPLLPETRSELALPLMTRGRLVGAMTIQSTRQAAFDQGDVTVLLVMADQLANAIENARVFQERERRMTQMGIVSEIGQALSTGMDLDLLFALVHKQVSRLFDADNFYIATYEEGSDFWSSVFHLEQGQPQPPDRHSAASGLTGWILSHRAPILFRSLEENTAFHEREGIPTIGQRARSWLGVPLVTSQKLVGAMGIQDYEQAFVYDESDQALFETVGAQVAAVLDNARLLAEMRERAREMEVVNEVGQVVTSVLDLDEVLRRLVDVTKERFGYYCVSIALVSESRMEIKYGSHIGDTDRRLDVAELALALGDTGPGYRPGERPEQDRALPSLVAECARTAQPVLVGDVLSDPRYLSLKELPDTRSELTVPIVSRGQLIGTLDVQSDERFAFDETDIAVLQLLASQAATAIENAQLFAETQRRADELGVLHKVSLELAQEQEDLRTVLETITRRTMDLLDSDGGGVWLWQPREKELELVITYQVGEIEFAGRRLKPGQGLTGQAFTQNRIQVVDDYQSWAGKSDAFSDAPFVSAMAIPMTWQAETVGVLVATRSQAGRQYKMDERELGELLAAQAASVIQNARLFAEREARAEELATVNEVGRAISSVLDLDGVLQQIVDTIKARFGHFFVGILLVEGDELVFRSSSMIGDTGVRWQQGDLRLALDGYGLTVAVANSGESILVNDVREDSRYGVVEGLGPVQAELDTPIKVKGQVIGVLTVESDRLNAFADRDVNLLQGLASQAGVAIENARLFDQAQAQLSSLTQIQQALAELNAAFTFDDAIAGLLPHVARIAHADGVRMYLVDGTQMTCVGVHSASGSDVVQVGETVSLDDYPLTKRVIETQEPLSLLCDDPRLQSHAREADRAAGMAANATIPLIGRQGVTGILSISRQHPGRVFGPQDVSLVQTLANQATTVLEKNQLFEETQRRSAELQSLYETSLHMSAEMETTELLAVIVERAAALVGAETAGLYIYEPRSRELVFSVAVGYLTEYVGRRIRPGEGLAGRVFVERQTMTVDDYQSWSGRAATYEREERLGTLLAVPLISGDTTLGVLDVGLARGRVAVKERDIWLTELFGAQAAVALENARLFEEAQARAHEQATLRHITETVSGALDTESMLSATLAQTLDALKLDVGLISLYDENAGYLVLAVERGLPEPMARAFVKKGLGGTLCDYVFRTGEAISIGDVRQQAPVKVDALIKHGLVAYAGTPLSSKGERIGTMCFFHRAVRKVEGDELALLEAIGGQIGLGIANVRLFEETETRAEELAVLNEMGRALAARLAVGEVIQNIYRYVSRLMDATNFYVALYHREAEEVSFPLAMEGGEQLNWSSRRTGNGLTEYVIKTAEPLLIRENIGDFIASTLGIEQIGRNAQSWLGAPMLAGDEVVGVVAVQSYDTPLLYDERHRDLLMAMAGQTAIAVQNARLFEEAETRARELAVLNEMARTMTAQLDVGDVLQNIYGYVSRLMDASNLYIAFNHPETEEVSFPLWLGDGEQIAEPRRHRRNGLTEYVIRTGETLLIQHDVATYVASNLEGVEHIGRSAQSWLGAPLRIGDEVLGVIAVQNYDTPYLYSERDRDLLISVASQAAIAIQNARLFEQTQGRARYERVLREITARVRASTNADTIMRTAVRELGSALDRPAFIRLGRGEEPWGDSGDGRSSASGNGGRGNAGPGAAQDEHLGEGGE